MVLTNTLISRNVVGNQKLHVINVTFDGSYPTGGESFVPADVGMLEFDLVVANSTAYGSGAYIVEWVTPKLKVIDAAFGAEALSTTDLSALSINVIALGR